MQIDKEKYNSNVQLPYIRIQIAPLSFHQGLKIILLISRSFPAEGLRTIKIIWVNLHSEPSVKTVTTFRKFPIFKFACRLKTLSLNLEMLLPNLMGNSFTLHRVETQHKLLLNTLSKWTNEFLDKMFLSVTQHCVFTLEDDRSLD